MMTTPPWLTASLEGPYTLIPRIEWSADWVTWQPLRALSGNHSQDRTRQTRWQMSGVFMNDYKTGPGGIHPFGPRLRIWLGVKTLRNPVWWLPQGVYTIETANADENAVTITGSSLEIEVSNSDFVKPRRIPDRRAESYRSQAETLILEAVPDARFYWDDRLGYHDLIPSGYFTSGRWTLVDGADGDISIMGALGGEAYCDAGGGFRFAPVPTLDDPPVWTVAPGGSKVTALRNYDRDGVFNVVGAGGSSADGSTTYGPVWAWDDDPTSITYAGPDPVRRPGVGAGTYGVKPTTYTSPLIGSDRQAGVAARAQLSNTLGLHYSVNLTAHYNPALEAGDIIDLEKDDGTSERHLMDTVGYTWGSASFQCVGRSPRDAKGPLTPPHAYIAVSDDANTGNSDVPPVAGGPGTLNFTALGGRSYKSDNTTLRSTTWMYQGYYDTTWGNNRAAIQFDYAAIAAALAGHTVTGVTLKFRTKHSYYNVGCKAVIGTHNATTYTTFNNWKVNRLQVPNCSAEKWTTVDLGPGIANEFKNGTTKGIIFGPGQSGDSKQYYGYHYVTGGSAPVLTFTYSS